MLTFRWRMQIRSPPKKLPGWKWKSNRLLWFPQGKAIILRAELGFQRGHFALRAVEFAVHFGSVFFVMAAGRCVLCFRSNLLIPAIHKFLPICVDIKNTWLYIFGFGMAFRYPRISHESQAIDNWRKCSNHVCSSLGYIKVKKPHLSLSCARHSDSHLKQSLFSWLSFSTRAFLKCFWRGFSFSLLKCFMASRNYRVHTQYCVLGGPTVGQECIKELSVVLMSSWWAHVWRESRAQRQVIVVQEERRVPHRNKTARFHRGPYQRAGSWLTGNVSGGWPTPVL